MSYYILTRHQRRAMESKHRKLNDKMVSEHPAHIGIEMLYCPLCDAERNQEPINDPPTVSPPTTKEIEKAEDAIEVAKEKFKEEPIKEQKAAEEKLEYPAIQKVPTSEKIQAYAASIIGDRSIDKEMKIKRLTYLIALNSRNHWVRDATAKQTVEKYLQVVRR